MKNFIKISLIVVLFASSSSSPASTISDRKQLDKNKPYNAIDVRYLNTSSDLNCRLKGYTEIEVGVSSELTERHSGFEVFAISNGQAHKVASRDFNPGYYQYTVEFFAGDCSTDVKIELVN